MKKTTAFLLFFAAFSGLFAQNLVESTPIIERRVILELSKNADPRAVERALESAFRRDDGARPDFVFKKFSRLFELWTAEFEPSIFLKKEAVAEAARKIEGVVEANFDFEVEYRENPNDPQFFKQWDLQKIMAEEAWDASTGGLTARGDTIVVAVLEQGINRSHPDLKANFWKNWGEIPDNGLDDDQNGYVDDFLGWDARGDSDSEGSQTPHAASVCGIIGAVGDNSRGVAGVNWNVKIMTLVHSVQFTEIVENYEYALAQRQLYNATGGKKGAFVVATNASFGASQSPNANSNTKKWCALYDSLGAAGIVSCGAAPNAATDIDQSPDVPGQCPSEFLIVVTNTDIDDQKVQDAGYGQKNVDLAAPGDGSWTTDLRPGPSDTIFYNTFGGCSAATPHVTGAVAWLFSLDCPILTEDATTAPAQSARRARDLILANVDSLPSLQNITKTGGRLNLLKILTAVRALCGGTVGPLGITKFWPNPATDKLFFEYETPDFATYQVQINAADGKLMWQDEVSPEQFSLKKFEVEVAHFSRGLYTLTILSKARGKASIKFAKW